MNGAKDGEGPRPLKSGRDQLDLRSPQQGEEKNRKGSRDAWKGRVEEQVGHRPRQGGGYVVRVDEEKERPHDAHEDEADV